jgi:hypothetical protein
MFNHLKYIKNWVSSNLITYERVFGPYCISLCTGPGYSEPDIFQDINLYNLIELEIIDIKSEMLLPISAIQKIGINNILNPTHFGYASFLISNLDLIEEVRL